MALNVDLTYHSIICRIEKAYVGNAGEVSSKKSHTYTVWHKIGFSFEFSTGSFITTDILLDRLCGTVVEFLATDLHVPGSIPGATISSEK
jgi:hypothetical protein